VRWKGRSPGVPAVLQVATKTASAASLLRRALTKPVYVVMPALPMVAV
jgi:hypothetical protein